ncbi:uncharacterized protein PV06_02253 [Exophiala oligosperma]|uniref:Phytanoyl-CoA dioxygenase n=1 Tax=Exophiala oligosperma TaxID=215243 RepID=A0A0D2DTU8_9EURO|nr:uncharacterized protein PV06_02253 [Exophiala oligosperma]KIW46588.1 hypothetical protein PV06_02253 [Exophiala oligosperma]
MAKSPNVEALERDGFVVIRSTLTPEEIEKLRNACHRVTTLARQGQWPNVRTLPKQFPPWNVKEGQNPAEAGIWGVQGLMHPAMLEHELFTATYFSDALINPTKDLLQCGDDDLVMELFNLLVRPDHDFELRWHRDDISDKATPEEELARLAKPAWHTQWNLALYDDNSLIVVPGSHRRARTETERVADPYEKGLPGELRVQMSPGDVVFYNNNILHRGAYDGDKERMTLHGSVGHVKGGSLRARNVLQHGLRDWIDQCDFSKVPNSKRGRAEGMRRRLIDLANKSGDVGYSLQG